MFPKGHIWHSQRSKGDGEGERDGGATGSVETAAGGGMFRKKIAAYGGHVYMPLCCSPCRVYSSPQGVRVSADAAGCCCLRAINSGVLHFHTG